MTRQRVLGAGLAGLATVVLLVLALIRSDSPVVDREPGAAAPVEEGDAAVPHIRATLFYGSAKGEHLVPVVREVELAESVDDQARQILSAALQTPQAPLLAAAPASATLRGFYTTEAGDAFVDISTEIATAHPGGSTAELLTVYSIVNAVTANLPSVKRVQILIDRKEVDSLAGHVDLRRPLMANMGLVREER